jgi:hypothetical protein
VRCISIWVGVGESSALKREESRLYIGFRSGTLAEISWIRSSWGHNGLCVGVSGGVPRVLFTGVGVWGLLNLDCLSV